MVGLSTKFPGQENELTHEPATHNDPLLHEWPHAPQFELLVWMFVSQPSVC